MRSTQTLARQMLQPPLSCKHEDSLRHLLTWSTQAPDLQLSLGCIPIEPFAKSAIVWTAMPGSVSHCPRRKLDRGPGSLVFIPLHLLLKTLHTELFLHGILMELNEARRTRVSVSRAKFALPRCTLPLAWSALTLSTSARALPRCALG